jgi:hypothetical protein
MPPPYYQRPIVAIVLFNTLYFVTPVLPMNRTLEAGFDFLGGVIVVGLSVGVVLLMRLLLAH